LQACKLLSDDYEQVRSAAVQLIWVVSQLYPERSVGASLLTAKPLFGYLEGSVK
jgi:hypothetical protein